MVGRPWEPTEAVLTSVTQCGLKVAPQRAQRAGSDGGGSCE